MPENLQRVRLFAWALKLNKNGSAIPENYRVRDAVLVCLDKMKDKPTPGPELLFAVCFYRRLKHVPCFQDSRVCS
jgi:hypothetical protein